MLENLRISDVAVHEVFTRGQDRRLVQPEYALALENLSVEAMTAFRQRATDALSAKAKSVEMQIIRTGVGTFQGDAAAMVALTAPEAFLQASRRVADRLAEAQTSQAIPGGIVIVFRGVTGPTDLPFVAVIKAEVQEGFRRRRDGTAVITEFVNDLFLTKATRLYKLGFMVASGAAPYRDEAWRCLVFDHHIVASNREAAAIYFYESLLGCGFREDSAYETAKFFNLTKEFAVKNIEDRAVRHRVQDSLFTYIKNDQAPTFTVDEFAERYVPLDIRDRYQTFMRNKQFPERAVRRDIAELRSRLKRRRFKYGTDIEFSASPEAMAEGRVSIQTQDAVDVQAEARGEITVITIKDPFVKEV
ncbi:nucleoid-associated protein [Pararhodobacter sp.]|uniref:nucleoid-associated protein n=1 Tax=Pararhodobacter sp. TaxID=2127056 RepID=UPI002AFDFE47|nr:nucleoid-associated protein [Pararhodobacter sp.]